MPTFYETNKSFKEISQINKPYELFSMDQSPSYIIRTYSHIETTCIQFTKMLSRDVLTRVLSMIIYCFIYVL